LRLERIGLHPRANVALGSHQCVRERVLQIEQLREVTVEQSPYIIEPFSYVRSSAGYRPLLLDPAVHLPLNTYRTPSCPIFSDRLVVPIGRAESAGNDKQAAHAAKYEK